MSVNRRAAKRDSVEAEIIKALIAAGCSVQRLSAKGVPDLLVGSVISSHAPQGYDVAINILMEVKTGKAKLTEDEQTWHDNWRGQVCVVRSVEDALRAAGR